jgi:hypothetical protein
MRFSLSRNKKSQSLSQKSDKIPGTMSLQTPSNRTPTTGTHESQYPSIDNTSQTQPDIYLSNPEFLPFWVLEQKDAKKGLNASPPEKTWNYPSWFDPQQHSMWSDEH